MSSKTTAANLALGHLAYGTAIVNVDTEQSAEAKAVRRFYDIALDSVLIAGRWSFAKKFATLNLVEEAPNDIWAYSYRLPSDFLSLVKINDLHLFPGQGGPEPKYETGSDDQGLLLYTSEEQARIEYIARKTTVAAWPADFLLAFTYLLASMIAPSVTGGDQFKLGERAYALYGKSVSAALARNLNQDNNQNPARSGFIEARG